MGLDPISAALIITSLTAAGTSVRGARTQRKAVKSGIEKEEEARTKATAEETKLGEQTTQRKLKRRGAVTERGGLRKTILTSPLGLVGQGAGTRKTLLGE